MEIHKTILDYLYNYSQNPFEIDRLIVSSFIEINNLRLSNNTFLKELSIKKNDGDLKSLEEFKEYFRTIEHEFTFEQLIKIFEFVISPSEKLINGAVYTPKNIREKIVSETSKGLSLKSKIGDISCGCGGFLYDYALLINKKYGKSYGKIFEDNIYGVDIAEYSIKRTKILLSLLALSNDEDLKEYNFNLYVADSVEFNWFDNCDKIRKNNGFDIIVGNPPYVGSTNIDDKTRKLLKNWEVTKTGKADLYIPFFEIGMHWLKPKGVLGYITVNTFLKSLNGRALRDYFKRNLFDISIIDFGGEQVFKDRLTYTAICFITKSYGKVKYLKSSSLGISDITTASYSTFDYEFLDSHKGWNLNIKIIEENIKKINNIGTPLGDLFEIRNGFATLRNKIYLFKPIREDSKFYYLKNDKGVFPIEKKICRNAIKPNILKSESEIEVIKEKIIYPYTNTHATELKANILPFEEEYFKKKFPFAYEYLNLFKTELSKRDKGNRDYQYWYLYGRTQALNVKGKKLLFPYISDMPYFVYTDDEELMFYNGYAILSDNEQDLLFIQKVLNSKVFWYYIKNTSKPYSNEYFSFAKNYIKYFGIPKFNNAEKKQLIKLKNKTSIDKFLITKYGLTI